MSDGESRHIKSGIKKMSSLFQRLTAGKGWIFAPQISSLYGQAAINEPLSVFIALNRNAPQIAISASNNFGFLFTDCKFEEKCDGLAARLVVLVGQATFSEERRLQYATIFFFFFFQGSTTSFEPGWIDCYMWAINLVDCIFKNGAISSQTEEKNNIKNWTKDISHGILLQQ